MSNIGRQKSANARIWLSGVDTPERGERCFAEATERFKGPLGGGKGFRHHHALQGGVYPMRVGLFSEA